VLTQLDAGTPTKIEEIVKAMSKVLYAVILLLATARKQQAAAGRRKTSRAAACPTAVDNKFT